MKNRFSAMRLLISTFLLLGLGISNFAHAQAATAKTAVESLRRLRSTTKWNVQSAKVADVDCDSKPDTIVLGSEQDKVVVGVVWGATAKKPQVFEFSIRADRQDGFCAAPTKIEVAPLDCESDEGTLSGCRMVRGCKAFSLSDEECDPFNFYWDAARKQLAWWRL